MSNYVIGISYTQAGFLIVWILLSFTIMLREIRSRGHQRDAYHRSLLSAYDALQSANTRIWSLERYGSGGRRTGGQYSNDKGGSY